jgi:hypothetical protein
MQLTYSVANCDSPGTLASRVTATRVPMMAPKNTDATASSSVHAAPLSISGRASRSNWVKPDKSMGSLHK